MGNTLRSSEQVASQLGCSRQYLLRRANEANLQNWVGDVRIWQPFDVEAIRPLVMKRLIMDNITLNVLHL